MRKRRGKSAQSAGTRVPGARSVAAILAPLLALGAGLGACSEEAKPAEPPGSSALLITLDTTRFDALTSNGAPPDVTPNLDALAREGTSFERAYSVAPLTLPAHASMLTGLYPPRHSVRSNGAWTLPDSATTLAEEARAAGYSTAAFVSAVVLARPFGLAQGFERYDAPRHAAGRSSSHYSERSARETVDQARAWLRERTPGERFFLWVHLWDPHGPNEPGEAFRGTTASPYLDEVRALDHAIGVLLDGLRASGAYDETMILVVGDHGEAFGEHGERSHGSYCYASTLHVPLILRAPRIQGASEDEQRGRRDPRIASVVDVFPTLADGMGFSGASTGDGRSLLGPPDPGRGVYFESYYGYLNYGWSPINGWLDAGGKYVFSTRPEFYDVLADPHEEHDLLASGESADSRALEERIKPYRAALRGVAAQEALDPGGSGGDPGPDTALLSALQGLGYAISGPGDATLPAVLEATGLPSPAERIEESGRILRALELANGERFAEAEALYASILAENPRNREALENLAFCQMRQLKLAEAIATYERLLASGRGGPRSRTYLGACMRASGRVEEALALYRQALEQDPEEVEALWQLQDLLVSLGRDAEAREIQAQLARLEEPPR